MALSLRSCTIEKREVCLENYNSFDSDSSSSGKKMTTSVDLCALPLETVHGTIVGTFPELRDSKPVEFLVDVNKPGLTAMLGMTTGAHSKFALKWNDQEWHVEEWWKIDRRTEKKTEMIQVRVDDSVRNGDAEWRCLWLDFDGSLGEPKDQDFQCLVKVTTEKPEDYSSISHWDMIPSLRHAIDAMEEKTWRGKPVKVYLSAVPPPVAFALGAFMTGYGRFPKTRFMQKNRDDGKFVVGGYREPPY